MDDTRNDKPKVLSRACEPVNLRRFMQTKKTGMFYLSAALAIIGAVGYQFFLKRVPSGINPIVSVLGIYVAVFALAIVLVPLFPANGGFLSHVRQLNWIQLALGVSVIFIELGFLLMYRSGWNLSEGNLVTGVVINLVLVALGVLLLGEKLSLVNVAGIVLSIAGVALISYKQ